MTELYTLDANILFYAADADAGWKHVMADDLVQQALASKCVMTMQALGELYNAISRRRPQHRESAKRLLLSLGRSLPIVSASFTDLQQAIQQHGQRPIQFWDTLLWATAGRYGCTTILTEDAQDRPVVGGVRYLNPFTAAPDDLAPFLP